MYLLVKFIIRREITMATIKAYTDISQSKKLAEILSIDSADMCYIKHASSDNPNWEFNEDFPPMILGNVPINEMTVETLPCWSLPALLSIALPEELEDNHFLTLQKEKNEYCCCYEDINGNSFTHTFATNPIDACVEMIIKLHEKDRL